MIPEVIPAGQLLFANFTSKILRVSRLQKIFQLGFLLDGTHIFNAYPLAHFDNVLMVADQSFMRLLNGRIQAW